MGCRIWSQEIRGIMVDGSSTFNLMLKLTTEFLNQPFAPQKASIQQPAAQSLPKPHRLVLQLTLLRRQATRQQFEMMPK
jgi:hypothetical protein